MQCKSLLNSLIFVILLKSAKKITSLFALVVIVLTTSCDPYPKLARKASIEMKFQYALTAFDKEEYARALPILEELITVYRGTANAEKVLFYYAYCNYNTEDYVLAAYHFKNFAKTFPTSPKTEECAYMAAYCYYLTSPVYSLDQTETKAALKELQSFVNTYPKSTRLAEANEIVGKLRLKLETKAAEIAKQYYNTSNFKSAIVAMNNFSKDYPDSKFVEELNYLLVKSHYMLTINSIETKKPERVKATMEAYLKFIDKYPHSNYSKDAENIYEQALKLSAKYKITT